MMDVGLRVVCFWAALCVRRLYRAALESGLTHISIVRVWGLIGSRVGEEFFGAGELVKGGALGHRAPSGIELGSMVVFGWWRTGDWFVPPIAR
jgi:hypothetical protein